MCGVESALSAQRASDVYSMCNDEDRGALMGQWWGYCRSYCRGYCRGRRSAAILPRCVESVEEGVIYWEIQWQRGRGW